MPCKLTFCIKMLESSFNAETRSSGKQLHVRMSWYFLEWINPYFCKTSQSLMMSCIDGWSCAWTVSEVIQIKKTHSVVLLSTLFKLSLNFVLLPFLFQTVGFMKVTCNPKPIWPCNVLRWMQPPPVRWWIAGSSWGGSLLCKRGACRHHTFINQKVDCCKNITLLRDEPPFACWCNLKVSVINRYSVNLLHLEMFSKCYGC